MMTQADFNAAENTIRSDQSSFDEIGRALIAIRDGHGYILAGYGSFVDYCTRRLGITYRHVDRLMRAAQIAKTLQSISVAPTAERQVRPLTGLRPTQQREAWRLAVLSAPDGRVTYTIVEDVVRMLMQ